MCTRTWKTGLLVVIAGMEVSTTLFFEASPRTAAAPPASVPSTPPVLTVVIPARCRASCKPKNVRAHGTRQAREHRAM